MSKICIVIPTYNESENLSHLIEGIERTLQIRDFRIIIVDDNSPDKTANIAKQLNRKYENIIVHNRPKKLGIGSAIRDGLKIALSCENCERIITMDGDLSHNPGDIPRLLRKAGKADLVQGSRYIKGSKVVGWSFSRRMLSYIANFTCKTLLKTHLHEHTTNFRVYSRRCAEAIVRKVNRESFEWQVEALLTAKDLNYEIIEVPITFVNRANGNTKLKISDIIRWVSFMIKAIFSKSLLRAKTTVRF